MAASSAKGMKTAVWLISAVLFALYLIGADRVYHVLSGKSYFVRQPAGFLPQAQGHLKLSSVCDYAPVNNPFEEGKEFRAKFYYPPDENGPVKLRVFFRSPDAVYEVVPNRRSFWAHTMKIAVNFCASTAGLENGVFTLGLSVEDKNGLQMAWIDSFFERTAGGPLIYVARPVALAPAPASDPITFALNRLDNNVIQGWVVLAGAEMNDYNAYVVIRNADGVRKAYYAPLYTRMDIAGRRGDPRAANSGFRISFSRDEFPPGTCTIRMALQSRRTGEVFESAQKLTVRR